jgi:hypothetical protein
VTLAVLGTKLDYLIRTVDKMVLRLEDHQRRIDNIENTVRILKWVSGAAAAAGIALLIAWVKTILAI